MAEEDHTERWSQASDMKLLRSLKRRNKKYGSRNENTVKTLSCE
jgi:hypothetical protein